MPQKIKTIRLSLPYKRGSVNCYLIETNTGFVLIDTGGSNSRSELEKKLGNAGCKQGSLKLIVITHGDSDHVGNAAYLRKKFDTKIAMHMEDSGMVEYGDMFWNRNKPNMLFRIIAPFFVKFAKSDRFIPDLYLDEGDELSGYGIEAEVLHIPGHSKGSIGILLKDTGDLIAGDLVENTDEPALNSITDDSMAANASLEKLKGIKINSIYPGHGKPFPMEQLTKFVA